MKKDQVKSNRNLKPRKLVKVVGDIKTDEITVESNIKKKYKKKPKIAGIMGAPACYKPKFPQMMLDWFTEKSEILYYERDKRVKESENKFGLSKEKETYLFPTDFPTFERFARTIGVCDAMFHKWNNWKNDDGTNKYPEFIDSYAQCKAIQRDCLLVNGLNGLYQSNFAQFVLQNHNPDKYKNKSEIDVGGQIENPIKIQNLDPDKLTQEELDEAVNSLLLDNTKK